MFFSEEPTTPVPFPANVGVDGVHGYCFTRVANFRDLGGFKIPNTNRETKQGMIFRTAAPTYASESDKQVLFDHLDILTLIDFRTSYETKNLNFGRPKLEDNFVTFTVKKDDGNEIDHIDRRKEQLIMEIQPNYSVFKRMYKGTPRVGGRRMSCSGVSRKRYSIPLINNYFFFEGVYPQAPTAVRVRCSAVSVLNEKVATYFLLRHLNDLGLYEMYRLTIEFTKREILTIFKIFRNPDNYPVMFFCSLGKDRTGIISALLLSCLGVDRKEIIENYHMTERCLESNMKCIKAYFDRIGLSKDEFVLAPRDTMKRLLEYVDRTYGSVKEYLNSIGFTYEDQRFLFEFLTSERKAKRTAPTSALFVDI